MPEFSRCSRYLFVVAMALLASGSASGDRLSQEQKEAARIKQQQENCAVRANEQLALIQSYKPIGKPVEGRLETPSVWTVKAKAGHCIDFILTFGDGTVLTDRMLNYYMNLKTTVTQDGEAWTSGADFDPTNVRPGSGAAGTVGCAKAKKASTLTLALQTEWKFGPKTETIGTGPFTIQFYEHKEKQEVLLNDEANELLCKCTDGCRELSEACRKCAKFVKQDAFEKCLGIFEPDDCRRGRTRHPCTW